MIPTHYDVIVDNPIETEADVKANLVFIKELARPYTLNIFSLRVIPLKFCRFVYLARRAFEHLRFMDFSVLTGRLGYALWRLGVITFWRKHFIPKYTWQSRDRLTSVNQA